MSNVKFHNNKYQRLRYNLKDSIIDKRKLNHPIKKKYKFICFKKIQSLSQLLKRK